MQTFPTPTEAAPYYFNYINLITSPDVVAVLTTQLDDSLTFLSSISDEQSLHRYAPEKWTIREVVNHINDTERLFQMRAFWFARGFDSPLPSFDQNICVAAARANELPWTTHVQEFRGVRESTLAFFRNLPAEAWSRSGIASDNPFTVRALAYIAAGHLAHHTAILKQKYLA